MRKKCKNNYSLSICLVLALFTIPVVYGNANPDASKPHTFLLRGDFLQSNKAKIKSDDPVLSAALKDLLGEADKILQKEPYSVTSKSKVPPSGDKRDYMSVGPYWWPDSSKADGLPYIRKDGQVNPERYSIKDADCIVRRYLQFRFGMVLHQ